MILANVLNNMVVALVFISAIMALSSSIEGINLAAATIAIYLGSNCAIGLPSANPVNAISQIRIPPQDRDGQTFPLVWCHPTQLQ